jgi:hypothetical protein
LGLCRPASTRHVRTLAGDDPGPTPVELAATATESTSAGWNSPKRARSGIESIGVGVNAARTDPRLRWTRPNAVGRHDMAWVFDHTRAAGLVASNLDDRVVEAQLPSNTQ